MLIAGKWINIEQLEEELCLPELIAILEKHREKVHEDRRFMAAMQGVDLDKNSNSSVEQRIEEVKRRAQARLAGGADVAERQEISELGFEVLSE